MAEKKLLIDTNVLVEVLRGNKKWRYLLESDICPCISYETKRELFRKKGMRKKEYRDLESLLELCVIVRPDTEILLYFDALRVPFEKRHLAKEKSDRLIAATALAKKLPLVTINHKHFSFIKGLKLVVLGKTL